MNTKNTHKTDWSRFDAMTEEERHAAALADPDAQPMTDEELQKIKPVPQVKIIRRALRLSRERDKDRAHGVRRLRPRCAAVERVGS